jgi:hypothetical protein
MDLFRHEGDLQKTLTDSPLSFSGITGIHLQINGIKANLELLLSKEEHTSPATLFILWNKMDMFAI